MDTLSGSFVIQSLHIAAIPFHVHLKIVIALQTIISDLYGMLELFPFTHAVESCYHLTDNF